jgi:DNA polymerase III gamma/tau subunit
MPPSSQTAYQALTAFKPRQAQDVMNEAETKYDIAGKKTRLSSLRGLVTNLESAVEAVDPSVTGRTSGNFTTEAQRSALVSREKQPILGSLAKEQQALGTEQQSFSESQSLATQMASALMNQDQTTYQKLLDEYNATLAAEQAAEQKRQYELNLAEQKRQFDEQQRAAAKASAGGAYNLGSIASALKGGSTPASDPNREAAYVDVQQRISSSNDRELVSDYNATLSSANKGNAKDKLKIQMYQTYRPDLFKSGTSFGGSYTTALKPQTISVPTKASTGAFKSGTVTTPHTVFVGSF